MKNAGWGLSAHTRHTSEERSTLHQFVGDTPSDLTVSTFR
jgi:hypothetical protein